MKETKNSTLVVILDEITVCSSNYNRGYKSTLYFLYWRRQTITLVAIMDETTDHSSSNNDRDKRAL